MERVPPVGRHATHVHHSFWVVPVDMKDGGVDHSSDVCGVGRRTRHPGICGEPDLRGRQERQDVTDQKFVVQNLKLADMNRDRGHKSDP